MFALFPSLESVIKPEQINAGCNLMILSSSLNDEFGALELALEPTVGAWPKKHLDEYLLTKNRMTTEHTRL